MFKSKHGKEVRDLLMRGISRLSRSVKHTLGPNGKLALIYTKEGVLHPTKDGVTIASHFSAEDPFENMGVKAVMQASQYTASRAGDGTTSTILLTEELCKGCFELIEEGDIDISQIRRDLEEGLSLAINLLATCKEECASEETLKNVCMVASNGDEYISECLASMIWKMGPNSKIIVESSGGPESRTHMTQGYSFNRGYCVHHFINDESKAICKFDGETKVLICDYPINNPKDIFEVLKRQASKNEPMLIIAPDFDDAVLSTLVLNRVKSGIKVCAVKAPSFGKYQDDYLEDMALATGGKVISKKRGSELSPEFVFDSLGSVPAAIITATETILTLNKDFKESILAKIHILNEQLTQNLDNYEKQHIEERIATLDGGIGKLLIGASTEMELRERIDRADDAKEAAYKALSDGIVPGAGLSLWSVSNSLKMAINGPVGNILSRGLRAPRKQLLLNCGKSESAKFIDLNETELIKKGIVDAYSVIENVLKNAISATIQVVSVDTLLKEEGEDVE